MDVDELARAVESCPSVARLAPGRGVEVATYLPGRRVRGIRVGEGGIEVHVAARYGPTMTEVAGEVRDAVAAHLGAEPVAVYIDEVELPG
ncbi:MAG: hypothetical protein ACR2K0_03565 [Acidimicrobiales bacterium]|jgi:uncharacterized alkaline shock family protein YloU